jgi:hypothetical protein
VRSNGRRASTGRAIAALGELGELIDALDRRVPHIERAGELQIARDATKLRVEAVDRINELRCADLTMSRVSSTRSCSTGPSSDGVSHGA